MFFFVCFFFGFFPEAFFGGGRCVFGCFVDVVVCSAFWRFWRRFGGWAGFCFWGFFMGVIWFWMVFYGVFVGLDVFGVGLGGGVVEVHPNGLEFLVGGLGWLFFKAD